MSTLVSYDSNKIGVFSLSTALPRLSPRLDRDLVRTRFASMNHIQSQPMCVPSEPMCVPSEPEPIVSIPLVSPRTLIRNAKKGVPVTIANKQLQTLTINNSCNLVFVDCNVERLEVIGEWTEAVIQGLKIRGESPLLIDGKCALENCKIESTKEPLQIDSGRLCLSNCSIMVTGKSCFRLADKTAISVQKCQIKLEDIMCGLSCFQLKGNCKVSVKYSHFKLQGDYVQTSVLMDSDENNKSDVKLTGVSIRCKSGCYLTCRHPMNTRIVRSNCDNFERVPLFERINMNAELLKSVIDDPLYTKRSFHLEDSLAIGEKIHVLSKKLTFTSYAEITDALDIEGSIFIRSFSSSSFLRKEGDFFAKVFTRSLSLHLVAYDCTFILSELVLDGDLNFDSSKVYIRECRVTGRLTARESSIKCDSVQFAPESVVNISFCKLRTRHCEFKSTIFQEDCDSLHVETTFV